MINPGCVEDAILQRYVEGTLSAAERERVAPHLAGCLPCRHRVAGYKQLMWDLEHPDEEPIPPEQEALYRQLMDRWAAAQRDPQPVRRGARSLVPAWAGYTVLWTRNVPLVGRLRFGRFLRSERVGLTRLLVKRLLRK